MEINKELLDKLFEQAKENPIFTTPTEPETEEATEENETEGDPS